MHHEGIHWISIFKPHIGRCIFIDSLGASSSSYGPSILEALDEITRNTGFYGEYECLPFPLQSPVSHLCGIYCLFFITLLCEGYEFRMIEKNFKHNSTYNDNLILSWFYKYNHF